MSPCRGGRGGRPCMGHAAGTSSCSRIGGFVFPGGTCSPLSGCQASSSAGSPARPTGTFRHVAQWRLVGSSLRPLGTGGKGCSLGQKTYDNGDTSLQQRSPERAFWERRVPGGRGDMGSWAGQTPDPAAAKGNRRPWLARGRTGPMGALHAA